MGLTWCRCSLSVLLMFLIYKSGQKELELLITWQTLLVPFPWILFFFRSFLKSKLRVSLLLQVRIAMVGKYVGMADSYLSVVKVGPSSPSSSCSSLSVNWIVFHCCTLSIGSQRGFFAELICYNSVGIYLNVYYIYCWFCTLWYQTLF